MADSLPERSKVPAMRFGFTLPNNWGVEDPHEVLRLAATAEQAGFDSVWVNHHILNVGYVADRLGERPYHDALTILTWAAAVTKRVRLGTSVLVLPYLHPMVLAKTLATLDVLSGGRVIAGVGVGSLPEENAALSVDYLRRGLYTDESIQVMKALWTQPEAVFAGEFFNLDGIKASPKPLQRPHLPIVVGGNRPPALRRVARLADGWHPLGLAPQSMASRLERIDQELAVVGRDRSELQISVRLDISIRANGDSAPEGAPPLHGTVDQIVAAVEAYRAVGVGEVVVSLSSADIDRQHAVLETLAQEVLPRTKG